ncbi:MAG: hypothetical protein B7X00_02100 [Legionella sp. 21-45-4]|nr:MAG: hypothetical protein B7X00_02100 [Legionella sp. 21-45-4]
MLFFGFTHCPSLCPTTMQALAGMMEQLQATHFSPLPRVVLISVDPNRDNLITLAQFVHTFNPDFYAARGNLVSPSQLAKQFGIGLEVSHTIEHTGTILVINPEGQLAAFLTTPHHAENLAQDYRQILMQTSYHASQGIRT